MREFYADPERQSLLDAARAARDMAYTPYSHFRVGAALLTKGGKVFSGCNIENASYTPTNCAERTAFFKAVSEGETEFRSICIVGGMEGRPLSFCAPCGVCRQVMREFCDPKSFEVLLGRGDSLLRGYSLEELLPEGFGPESLL